jgi:3-methyladenine DNA glycosylase AlkD
MFKEMANASVAAGQKAYMRNQFEFYGLKTPVRRALQKQLFQKERLPPKDEVAGIVKTLWGHPQRECHYLAQELLKKYLNNLEEQDIALYEFMITHNSWWDTVDFIAVNLVGRYFRKFPSKRDAHVTKWLASGNIWLQRTALLFQLKYKESLDTTLLSDSIEKLLGSGEFFINKAIGWILREYSKTNAAWVIQFVNSTPLHSLSRKEALRLMKPDRNF